MDPAAARKLYAQLASLYPDAGCALNFRSPFELLVATILSAQCTDARVNMVTPALFERFPNPQAMRQATTAELEELIRSTGFYHNKARSILGTAAMLIDDFSGQVPRTMDELLRLPGVARKTANVVLGNAYGVNAGVPVDTHVMRLSQRLGLSRHSQPVKIEPDLIKLYPPTQWTMLAHLLISHGRKVCTARKPACDTCPLRPDCPQVGVVTTQVP